MSILKEQPKQPKTAMIQVRVEEHIKIDLDHYAEFIHSSEAWVVSEALKYLFKKGRDFANYKSEHNGHNNHQSVEVEVPSKAP